MELNIESMLETLECRTDELVVVGVEILEKSIELHSAFSIYIASIINRTIQTNRGFISVMSEGNSFCGASLVRVQMDNALRFYAATISQEDREEFCHKVFSGEHVGNQKSRENKKMTDSYLHKKYSENGDEWFSELYAYYCGFIHFSRDIIIRSMIPTPDSTEGNVRLIFGGEHVSDDDSKIIVRDMLQVFESVLKCIDANLSRR